MNPVPILQSLIRCPSVTPVEGGALDYLEQLLRPAGFRIVRLPFSEPGTADVDNLYARYGRGRPHLCFAGHTDVVPPGREADWTHPPFAGVLASDQVWGRGAADMKGGIAAFAAAVLSLAAEDGLGGSVSFLITGDEEDKAINGTAKVLAWIQENGEIPDHCLVGEPTSRERLGDGVKIGRRGSVDLYLTTEGRQGHVAYPENVINPIHLLARIIDRLHSEPIDTGNEWFGPSTVQCVTADTGNPARNVVPARATARFNVRHNTLQTPETLGNWVRRHCDSVVAELGGSYVLDVQAKSDAFVTEAGPLLAVVTAAIEQETGVVALVNTGGGTSDARFIKDFCPVVEFGPLSRTIHQVDERISVDDLESLTKIYRSILQRYFAAFRS
jgi:succinyl-diaminopimelate desuccinylase